MCDYDESRFSNNDHAPKPIFFEFRAKGTRQQPPGELITGKPGSGQSHLSSTLTNNITKG